MIHFELDECNSIKHHHQEQFQHQEHEIDVDVELGLNRLNCEFCQLRILISQCAIQNHSLK